MLGDLKVNIDNENVGLERAMEKHGYGQMNKNVERLVDFWLNFDLVIEETLFKDKNIHKLTWMPPDGKIFNQIKYLMINNRCRRSLLDICVFRSVDLFIDNFLVVGSIRLK